MNKKIQEFEGVISTLKESAKKAIVIDDKLFIDTDDIQRLGDILTNLERCAYSAKVLFVEALRQLVGSFDFAVACDIEAENSNKLFVATIISSNREILPKWDYDDEISVRAYSYSYCAEEAVANLGSNLIKQYLKNYGSKRNS